MTFLPVRSCQASHGGPQGFNAVHRYKESLNSCSHQGNGTVVLEPLGCVLVGMCAVNLNRPLKVHYPLG
jgi:hypothetical protein